MISMPPPFSYSNRSADAQVNGLVNKKINNRLSKHLKLLKYKRFSIVFRIRKHFSYFENQDARNTLNQRDAGDAGNEELNVFLYMKKRLT